jgi:restriction endonuclease
MARRVFRGTGLKFRLNIEADGFNMNEDDFEIKVYTKSDHVISIPKNDMQVDDEGNYSFVIDSDKLECGQLVMETIAYILDDDFPDGTRKEIDKRVLCNIIS